MSTKCSILYEDGIHVYTDFADGDDEIVHIDVESGNGYACVALPPHIWEAIRTYQAVDIALADKTDEQIRRDVEEFVAKRLSDCKGDMDGLMAARGAFVYGAARDAVEKQIECGVAYFTAKRVRMQEIKCKRDALIAEMGPHLRIIKIGGDE